MNHLWSPPLRTLLLGSSLILRAAHLPAADWPQLLGPDRDGVATAETLSATWPQAGPPIEWKKKVGAGFSAPVVADGRLILFHRQGNEELIEAWDAVKGTPLWRSAQPTAYRDSFGFDPGPRGTPAVAGGKIYTFGAEGRLTCTELASGKTIWSVDCRTQFAAPQGFFGLACSPLVEGGAVIVNVGGKDSSSLVAFDNNTGKVRWRAIDDEPSYSSPIAATLDGQRLVLALTRGNFVGLNAADGATIFQHPFRPPQNASVTGATPVLRGNDIFISAAYDTGAQLLRFQSGRLEKLWGNDESLSLQYSSPVRRDGFLYGLHGRHDFPAGTELRCIDFATGKVRWAKPGLKGSNLILAGAALLVLAETGELIRVNASPESYQELGRAQILGSGVRAYPALANGLFYARGKDTLVCVSLR